MTQLLAGGVSVPRNDSGRGPAKRPERFLRWNGDNAHLESGSANIDVETAGHTEWLSWWGGAGDHPTNRPEDQRRPQRVPSGRLLQGCPELSLPPLCR